MSEIMFADGLVPEEDLAHYGTPRHSGRYPWGSGNNPYHHGASSPLGKLKERHKAKKLAKVRKASLEKARQAKVARAEHERLKSEALKSGSAKQIAPYIREMSDDELRAVKNRLQLEAEFRSLVVKEVSATNPKVEIAMAKAEKMTNYANTGMNAYNAFAKVHNTFSTKGDLPVIGSKSRKDILKTTENTAMNRANANEILAKRKAETRKAEAEARASEIVAKTAELELNKRKNKKS